MNRDTARAIIAAAALMTVQALLLAALATSTAHARTVYRCPSSSAGGTITYQAQPCQDDARQSSLQAADHRTPAQQAQAQETHTRQMRWLAQQEPQASPGKARTSSTKKRKARRNTPTTQASTPATAQTRQNAKAVALTSHRIGQRPFERLGQQVSTPDRGLYRPGQRQRNKPGSTEITARTPKPAASPHGTDKLRPAQ
jgi:hypothetical protein